MRANTLQFSSPGDLQVIPKFLTLQVFMFYISFSFSNTQDMVRHDS